MKMIIDTISLSLCFFLLSISHCFGKQDNQGKEEVVSNSAYSLDIPGSGTLEVYPSINNVTSSDKRFYIAPQLRFLPVDGSDIIRASSITGDDNLVECQMAILMLAPDVRQSVAERVSELVRSPVKVENVGNLRIYAIIVDVESDSVRRKFRIKKFLLPNPAYSEKLDVSLSLDGKLAPEFVKAVNDGEVTFRLSYVFQNINLDNRYEKLDLGLIKSSKSFRDLDQQGKELMSVNQFSDFSSSIIRDITSVVVEGLGAIEPASIPAEKLAAMFDIGDIWKKDNEELSTIEERLRKQLDLKVNPADFQPFRVQKHVIETANQTTDIEQLRSNYSRDYMANQNRWNVSGGFGIGPFSASGGYAAAAQKVSDKTSMSDDNFRNFLKTYHGVEYNTEERLWRGLRIYDLSTIKNSSKVSIVSVTYQPRAAAGIRYVTVRPKKTTKSSSEIDTSIFRKLYDEYELEIRRMKDNPELLNIRNSLYKFFSVVDGKMYFVSVYVDSNNGKFEGMDTNPFICVIPVSSAERLSVKKTSTANGDLWDVEIVSGKSDISDMKWYSRSGGVMVYEAKKTNRMLVVRQVPESVANNFVELYNKVLLELRKNTMNIDVNWIKSGILGPDL